MRKPAPLDYKQLCKKLDNALFTFSTTAELEPLGEFIGQDRALESIAFGIGIKNVGYNLYAMGPSGIGKRSLVRSALEVQASKQATPSDWCYVHDFTSPDKSLAIELPAGLGNVLKQDMQFFMQEFSTGVVALFESDEYHSKMKELNDAFTAQREAFCKQLLDDAKNTKVSHLYKELHKQEQALQYKLTFALIDPPIQKLSKKYQDYPDVIHYLDAVAKDILQHVNDYIKSDENTNVLSFASDHVALIKYQVNLFVDNSTFHGVPVIFEENPSYSNLICRVEHISQFGSLVTNFTLIRSGSLHKANGGYLIIEARKITKETKAWEALKRALYARKILIEPIEHSSDNAPAVSMEPMPIPLDVKVILLGSRKTYYSLCKHDPDFTELFKVAVDFDEQINKNPKNIVLYSRLIGTMVRQIGGKPFSVSAVKAIIEYSSRLVEDNEKLSTHISSIEDLVIESDYWAAQLGKKMVSGDIVKKAIAAKIRRLDRSQKLYYEDIQRDFILIKTEDALIGQVNCLSVVSAGHFSYGHPTRLTAKVRMGKGKVLDIQREIKMAGPIHSKAGLIIANFLADRYNPTHPFSLSASLAFEQIYGAIDGDSASVAELCALLSALSFIPIKQSLAVTGSINQYGEVQAVGGVNDKIEGFFDICVARGLTGQQGVLIPAVNKKNLMLRDDVVAAAKLKQFFIYPIETIDEAITLLTGVSAGELTDKGCYPLDSVNGKVGQRLKEFSLAVHTKKK